MKMRHVRYVCMLIFVNKRNVITSCSMESLCRIESGTITETATATRTRTDADIYCT